MEDNWKKQKDFQESNPILKHGDNFGYDCCKSCRCLKCRIDVGLAIKMLAVLLFAATLIVASYSLHLSLDNEKKLNSIISCKNCQEDTEKNEMSGYGRLSTPVDDLQSPMLKLSLDGENKSRVDRIVVQSFENLMKKYIVSGTNITNFKAEKINFQKPAGHIVGLKKGKTTNNEAIGWVTSWKPKTLNEMSYLNGRLKIQVEGLYFVYSHIYFYDHQDNKESLVHLTCKNDEPLMRSVLTQEPYGTRYHGGLFHLLPDDEIYVRITRNTTINMDGGSSFFGAVLLEFI